MKLPPPRARHHLELPCLLFSILGVVVLYVRVGAWEEERIELALSRRAGACAASFEQALQASLWTVQTIEHLHAVEEGRLLSGNPRGSKELGTYLKSLIRSYAGRDLVALGCMGRDPTTPSPDAGPPEGRDAGAARPRSSLRDYVVFTDRYSVCFPAAKDVAWRKAPPHRQARARAAATGKAAAVFEPEETEGPGLCSSLTLYVPLYAPRQPVETPRQREDALIGYAVGIFQVQEMFRDVLAKNHAYELDFYLAQERPGRDGHALLARRVVTDGPLDAQALMQHTGAVQERVDICGTNLLFVCVPTVHFRVLWEHGWAGGVLLVGIVYIAVFSTHLLTAMLRLRRVTRFGDERTTELAQTSKQLEQEVVERESAQEETRVKREQLLQADKMATLGVLVAGVAHEISNPNSTIMLQIPPLQDFMADATPVLRKNWLKEGEPSPDAPDSASLLSEMPVALERMQKASAQIGKIVRGLRDFSRGGTERIEIKAAMAKIIDSAVLILQHQINQATTQFHVDIPHDLPPVRGSKVRLQQVVMNIIQNACDALPDTGRGIFVSAHHDAARQRVVLEVRDEGIGIKPEHIANLTDPFYTSHRATGGTGLGLSVSAGIVREHQGDLSFASEPGAGTTVTVSLPIAPPKEKSHGKA